MTLKLTAMRGYPGSGKSTKAKEIAAATGAVRVCRDDLRKMLHDNHYTGKTECEEQVTTAERAQVHALLKAGTSVVVDATHLEPRWLRKWQKMAAQYGAEFEVIDVDTGQLKCAANNLLRKARGERHVGSDVIERMAKRYPIKNWPKVTQLETFTPEPVEWIDGLPEAIIVDIDGTVAHMAGRSPYDYTQVHTDTVDEHVRWLVNTIAGADNTPEGPPHVLFVSGRDDECREATDKWLVDNCIYRDELHMRPTGAKDANGNKLPDYRVKYDLFNQHIRGKYNVRFVLDDRDQVVNLWRALGLKCLQVQPGDF
ncbi:phosphatase domain-containing protein [Mycobacteroides abscessus]|uniref:phosphatase domain-containing protein n=1 Tax=Mycobacteroides abscessus TaxID=36809 RepID=UPI00092B3A4E|nr:AAA family ATPase [Mycobacteroides abscessus]SHY52977.1 Predicted kinase [Mycobacteroides abscessus subsp. abscessus]SHY62480.1 Predicted kinase [Mycobacteroides abscessus subsp. abscessus]SHY72082.1 Predicted kinase [Mycobacteroides abscessus subsp. abscessus]SIA15784.1 Predicted kinase [Mycobacteroides abscessus subsp. abscessus]SIB17323.1 Predicted kinase [Mycobacteroides abscessus subsp. abscessus]